MQVSNARKSLYRRCKQVAIQTMQVSQYTDDVSHYTDDVGKSLYRWCM